MRDHAGLSRRAPNGRKGHTEAKSFEAGFPPREDGPADDDEARGNALATQVCMPTTTSKIQNYTKTLQDHGEWPTDQNVGDGERVVSAVAGGTLVAFAALKGTPLAIVGGMLGVGLLARGVSGTCQLYRAMGKSTVHRASIAHHALPTLPTREEAKLDDTLDDSFPCSDPPAW